MPIAPDPIYFDPVGSALGGFVGGQQSALAQKKDRREEKELAMKLMKPIALELQTVNTDNDVESIRRHIREIGEKFSGFGMPNEAFTGLKNAKTAEDYKRQIASWAKLGGVEKKQAKTFEEQWLQKHPDATDDEMIAIQKKFATAKRAPDKGKSPTTAMAAWLKKNPDPTEKEIIKFSDNLADAKRAEPDDVAIATRAALSSLMAQLYPEKIPEFMERALSAIKAARAGKLGELNDLIKEDKKARKALGQKKGPLDKIVESVKGIFKEEKPAQKTGDAPETGDLEEAYRLTETEISEGMKKHNVSREAFIKAYRKALGK